MSVESVLVLQQIAKIESDTPLVESSWRNWENSRDDLANHNLLRTRKKVFPNDTIVRVYTVLLQPMADLIGFLELISNAAMICPRVLDLVFICNGDLVYLYEMVPNDLQIE